MPLQPRPGDEYWDGMLKRRLKRLWPLAIALGILAGGILLAAWLS